MKKTNSNGRKQQQEAGFINRSLYVLGQVIQGLARNAEKDALALEASGGGLDAYTNGGLVTTKAADVATFSR